MWSYFWRESHPNRRKRKLASPTLMRHAPGNAAQDDPVSRGGGSTLADGKFCRDTKPPLRIPNKLRKERRYTSGTTNSQSCILGSKQSSCTPRTKLESKTHIRSNSSQKNTRLSPNKPTRARHTTRENAIKELKKPPDSMEPRGRTCKLQKRYHPELGSQKSQKIVKETCSMRDRKVKSFPAAYDSKRPMAVTSTESGPRLITKKQKIRTEAKHRPSHYSLNSLDYNSSPRYSSSSPSDNVTAAYMLSTLDALSARPTIKCAFKPHYVPPHSYAIGSLGRVDQKPRNILTSGEDLVANKTVDYIADHLSAHELRELMERDQKRREKDKTARMSRVSRRVSREVEKKVTDKHVSPAILRNDHGQNIAQSGQELSSKSIKGKEKLLQPHTHIEQQASYSTETAQMYGNVFSQSNDHSEATEPALGVLKSTPEQIEPISRKCPAKKDRRSTISQYLAQRLSDSSATASLSVDENNGSSTKPPQTWSSFFKIHNKKTRLSESPSFYTTSRDSLHSEHPTPSYTNPMRSTSSIPKRTVSKFREDLPDFSISSKSSRILTSGTPDLPETKSESLKNQPHPESIQNGDQTLSNHRDSLDFKNQGNDDLVINCAMKVDTCLSTRTISRSLASIDSEASWLSSGRECVKSNSKKGRPNTTNSITRNNHCGERLGPAKLISETITSKEDQCSHRSISDKNLKARPSEGCGDKTTNEASFHNLNRGMVSQQLSDIHFP